MSEENPYRNKTESELEFEKLILHQSGVFTRLIALFVDITIALLTCIPLVNYVAEKFSKNIQNGRIVLPIYDYKFSLAVLGVFFLICFISAIFECSPLRGTLGKWLVGNEVVNGFKQEVIFYRALGRQFLKFGALLLIAVFPFVSMEVFIKISLYIIAPAIALNLLIAFFSPEKQAIHDLAVRTYVTRHPEKNILIPLLVLVVSIFVSIQTIYWIKD